MVVKCSDTPSESVCGVAKSAWQFWSWRKALDLRLTIGLVDLAVDDSRLVWGEQPLQALDVVSEA